MSTLQAVAILWPFVLVVLGLVIGRVLRRTDGPGEPDAAASAVEAGAVPGEPGAGPAGPEGRPAEAEGVPGEAGDEPGPEAVDAPELPASR